MCWYLCPTMPREKVESGEENVLAEDLPLLVRDIVNCCSAGMIGAGLAQAYFNGEPVDLEDELQVGRYAYYVKTPAQ